jgi:methylthioribose-1-phosphate isomerase
MEETRWKEKNQYLGLTEDGRRVRLLDQSQLPNREVWLELEEPEELAEAIRTLRVRGAPAIGVFAAYALYVLARRLADRAPVEAAFRTRLREWAAGLAATRPTAVNLRWAVERVLGRARVALDGGAAPAAVADALFAEAKRMEAEDEAANRAIGAHGAALLRQGSRVLTHCNAGSLATAFYGTALGVVYAAAEQGKIERVYADETRPVGQGARLTSWELARAGVPCTLVCDNMAASLMAKGEVDAVIVGADRIAANGDAANKIGTYGVAVLARHHGIPFYVAAPTSTIDPAIADGSGIPIEERDASEVLPVAIEGVDVWNPAFDVTPAGLITRIVTERGAFEPDKLVY